MKSNSWLWKTLNAKSQKERSKIVMLDNMSSSYNHMCIIWADFEK
jgi:hypothetical protein